MPETPNDNWKNLGEDIKMSVLDAISRGDFSNLGVEIRGFTDRAMNNAGEAIRSGVGQQKTYDGRNVTSRASDSEVRGGTRYSSQKAAYNGRGMNWKVTPPGAGGNGGRPGAGAGYSSAYRQNVRNNAGGNAQNASNAQSIPHVQGDVVRRGGSLYKNQTPRKVFSSLGVAGGYSVGAIMGATFLGMLLANGVLSVGVAAGAVALLGLGAFSNSELVKASRFDSYVRALQQKTYASIEDLSKAVGKKSKFVKKDLQKMIDRKWFTQGHLDDQSTTLITSNSTYGTYLEMRENEKNLAEEKARKAKEEEARKHAEDAMWAAYTPMQREMIEQGNFYISEIKRCNDLIPGEEISGKLDRLEESAKMIIGRVKEKPSSAEHLRMLMNYYFPTTVKLLEAYADLDSQGKSSENIEKSKAEIENTIDAMNEAFDKIFDNLFETTNLDISTDAEVMQNMLKREGLLGEDSKPFNYMG